jgi:sugar (pentulose or hexulose) kinase
VTVDLGATSGRVVVGRLDRGHLEVHEVYRFHNEPSGFGREQHWNAEELFAQTVVGLQRAAAQLDGSADSMGVTGWGVDVGLVDNDNTFSTTAPRAWRQRGPGSIASGPSSSLPVRACCHSRSIRCFGSAT